MIHYILHILTACSLKNIGGKFGDIEASLDRPPGGLHQELCVSDVKKPAVVEGEHGLPLLDFLRKNVSTTKMINCGP